MHSTSTILIAGQTMNMMRPSRPLAVGLLCLVATSGCAGLTRNERAGILGANGVGAIAVGALLLNAQPDCSGYPAAVKACTPYIVTDFAATLGGGMLVAAGVVLLAGAGYLLLTE